MCIMMISPGVFFFFNIFIFSVVMCVKGQKIAQTGKIKIMSVLNHISGTVSTDHDFWYAYVKWFNITRCIFHFFKIFVFQIVSEVKGQRMAQNDKAFCLLSSISLELYILLPFMVHMCKILSPGIFHVLRTVHDMIVI